MTDTMYTTRFAKASDMAKHSGKEIGLSDWVTIDQEKIDTFAKATGDFQWIHTDSVLASEHSPYGSTIAHGFLVLSLAPKLIYGVYHIDDAVMAVNYGLDKVRFPNAVPVDSDIQARVVLQDVEKLEEGVKLVMNLTFEIRDQEKPACVADFIVLIITSETESV